MPAANRNPYEVLGVSPRASDAELHAAYRRLVQLHHPDHNGGSLEATRRFEEVQAAYAAIREQREKAPRRRPGPSPGKAPPSPRETADPNVEARLADIERELREARAASEQARRSARAEAAAGYQRPSDEELGYVSTDDSFGKILADARTELSDRLGEGRDGPAREGGDRPAREGRDQAAREGRDRPVGERVADLLDELAAKLRGDRPSGSQD